ncbi:Flp pilus assembly protein CpaB [Devosia sp. ZB163]|uniref:Flp pilus assembly protein CpaB n=1 Tax=Devosia sp. ZB163 TaxID=3025938 RepID=UPI00236031BA|nr:Flp pilus assembly protein CpaB [Devosia sp. ZB163]MDC9823225.1 Flp pilus assembly protein CpaB [Devosia sp. ZB163]
MNASRIILLVVALVAGGLAAFLAIRGSAPQQVVVEGPTQVVEEQKAKVLVAQRPIGVGQRLAPATIQWQDWPELAVRPEYITEAAFPDAVTQMQGAVARFEIFAGEPISEQKLVRSDQGYLSAVLTKGMRGVSVPVSADAAAGGFVVPNDRVDVVMTRGGVSQTILTNVKVLAIGTRLGQVNEKAKKEGEQPGPVDNSTFQGGTIATLELTPAQGELIINSSRMGALSVVLRSIADFAQAPGDAVRNETSRAVKMIRFGVGATVMPSDPGSAATVADAAYTEVSTTSDVADGDGAGAASAGESTVTDEAEIDRRLAAGETGSEEQAQ